MRSAPSTYAGRGKATLRCLNVLEMPDAYKYRSNLLYDRRDEGICQTGRPETDSGVWFSSVHDKICLGGFWSRAEFE